ncbi:MAG: hypothetical protein EXS17_06320 [Phycisphaerales bacterium]|nr:hypothetical protein [Phycisphaerales bacterium]
MNQSDLPLADRISMGAILVAVGARAMLAFAAIAVFDMDPAIEAASFVGAVPAESVLLDALALGGASWLIVRRVLSPNGVGTFGVLAALLSLAAIALLVMHACGDAEQLWRASTWIAGVALAIAVVSQANVESGVVLRRAAVAALGGFAVVMAVRGLSQMSSEHFAMVRYYEETKSSFLTAHGWLPESSQALAYERRLLQNEATGWFGFSNVFATVAVASAVLMGNMAIGRGSLALRLWLGIAAFFCVALVALSGSKGGVASLTIGLILSVLLRRKVAWSSLLLVALPLIAIGGVIARGLAGSQWAEQSLLFRWYYLVGAAKTFVSDPWTGVGAAGFQRAFLQFRPQECVEEVLSAHGAFADWMIAVGLAGIGLIAVQLLFVWWGRPQLESGTAAPNPRKGVAELSVASVVFATVISIAFEAPAIDSAAVLFWRLGGLALGSATAWVLARIMAQSPEQSQKSIAIGLSAMSAVVLTHGQIDMVFWLPGSAMWGWLTIALAVAWNGRRSARVPRKSEKRFCATIAGLFAAIAVTLVLVVRPALVAQDNIALSAALLINSEAQANSTQRLALARAQAAHSLADAALMWPMRGAYAVCAAQQWLTAASADPSPADAAEWLRAGRASASTVEHLDSAAFSARLVQSTLAIRQAEIAGGEWQSAESAIEAVLALNARHTESWLRLGVVREQMADRVGARAALQGALDADASFALDPLRQFSVERRSAIEGRMRALEALPQGQRSYPAENP